MAVGEGEDLAFVYSRDDGTVVPEIATTTAAGLVKSSLSTGQGKVSVNINTGEMTLNDYINMMLAMSNLTSRVEELEEQVAALQSGKETIYVSPDLTPLHGLTLSQALAYINNVITGVTAATFNHSP